jgi:uncharacterized protein (DUF1697 family)
VTSPGWVALLRAVNLGARNKVPMAQLRPVLEGIGCEGVRTYIQSGNVVFTSAVTDRAALAGDIERAIHEAFGVSSAVVLRTFAELARMVAAHPFGEDASHTYVAFLAAKPAAAKVRSLKTREIAPDRVHVAGSDVFLHYANGVQGARLSAAQLERHLGVAATVRNWRTVSRLAEMVEEAQAA